MAESGIVQTEFSPVVFTILENIDLLTLNRVIFMECTYTCKILHFILPLPNFEDVGKWYKV